LGCVGSLVGLLAHENTDIAIDSIEILSELMDEDVEAEQEQWSVLVDAMVEADLLDLLVSNFTRFKEANESDRSGVYYALSVLENLASQISLSEKIGQDTTVLKWLLGRIQKRESPVSQNKQYAAEVMAILIQSSPVNRRKLCDLDVFDLLLQKYTVQDLTHAQNPWEFIKANTSVARAFPLRGEITFCKDGAAKLDKQWKEEINNAASIYGGQIIGGGRQVANTLISRLSDGYGFLTKVSVDGESLLKTNLVANAMSQALSHYGANANARLPCKPIWIPRRNYKQGKAWDRLACKRASGCRNLPTSYRHSSIASLSSSIF